MLDTSQAESLLAGARAYADNINLRENLEEQLRYLDGYAERGDRGRTRCVLYPDGAPYSFGFVMQARREGVYEFWFNGGLLLHGPHDGGGNGGSPTFAVCLQPTVGWSVHT